jgi:xylulokinase
VSLLGIDVGTTGCKAVAFSIEGRPLASSYEEYDVQRVQPGYAELDTLYVWEKVKLVIKRVTGNTRDDPIQALVVSSLGEAVVPVTYDRRVLGPSLLNFDQRGEEFVSGLCNILENNRLYRINGNTVGNHYSLTKLLWLKTYQPKLYDRTDLFLHWSGFVSFMLGAEPVVDFSLANRSLLFDLDKSDWSDELITLAGIERGKLPRPVPSGTVIGEVSYSLAEELGLPPSVAIVAGAHDQCANALGCGVIHEGQAMYGMGTYICVTPVYEQRKDPARMITRGLNTEHHAAPGLFASFIYNPGGALVKWYRDTFASVEKKQILENGGDIYTYLISEIPQQPSDVLVLPHFAPTGPPEFITDSSGVMIGLRLETQRGDILKGILEGTTYYIRECIESLPETGITIQDFRAVGGGSKSNAWIQLCADILGCPISRPIITEAGALGAAILGGIGKGIFSSVKTGVEAMVSVECTFDPNPNLVDQYTLRYEQYRQIWPLMKHFLLAHE